MTQVPFIEKSALLGRWRCITKYKVLGNGLIEAKEQWDIHSQIQEIIKEAIKQYKKKHRTFRYKAKA